MGNHDLDTANGQPYLDYFELPGNERYYDFQKGDAHFFILNSDRREADGRASNSIQARWLQAQMSQSTAAWKLIFMHHTPFTSSWRRSPDKEIQWPFAEWGATAVFSGHDHFYERAEAEDIPYFVNGAGGKQLYRFGTAVPESVVRYNLDYGAMRVQVEEGCINFAFYNRGRELIDSITIWE